jgi:hypothetical protein
MTPFWNQTQCLFQILRTRKGKPNMSAGYSNQLYHPPSRSKHFFFPNKINATQSTHMRLTRNCVALHVDRFSTSCADTMLYLVFAANSVASSECDAPHPIVRLCTRVDCHLRRNADALRIVSVYVSSRGGASTLSMQQDVHEGK